MVAPIVISIIVIAYYVLYFGMIISLIDITAVKVLLGIIPLLLSGVMIYVCVQRIREIKNGEEDDLSRY